MLVDFINDPEKALNGDIMFFRQGAKMRVIGNEDAPWVTFCERKRKPVLNR
jgi:hypothetical protein